jgi:hypothetical protein
MQARRHAWAHAGRTQAVTLKTGNHRILEDRHEVTQAVSKASIHAGRQARPDEDGRGT